LVNSDAYLDAFRDESDTGSGTRLISSVAEIGKDWKVNYTRLANSSLSISISEHDAPTEESADD
jgi:hypothetical protein